MGIPETIWVILATMVGGLHLQSHGERRKDKWNFFAVLSSAVLMTGLFYWGGFFDLVGIPEMIWAALIGCDVGLHLWNHGKQRKDTWNFFCFLISVSLSAGLLYWGGFFN